MRVELVRTEVGVGFLPARRVHQALTAALERRALEGMARRMPAWVSSDGLTLLGLGAQMGAGLAFTLARYHRFALLVVIVCIGLNWFGDSMDGTLARVRGQQRPRYGFYVDHVLDVLGAVALMCGLGASGFVHWQIALAMLVGFLVLSCESYLATYCLSRFEMSQGMFGPTEIRLLLVAGTVALLHSKFATVFGQRLLLFDVGGTIAAACMLATAMALVARHAAQLYREEPLP